MIGTEIRLRSLDGLKFLFFIITLITQLSEASGKQTEIEVVDFFAAHLLHNGAKAGAARQQCVVAVSARAHLTGAR